MEMTEFEIIKDYGEAKDKTEQIKILADLNMCKPEDIAAVLKKNGIPLPKGVKLKKSVKEKNQPVRTKGKKRMNWTKEDLDKLSMILSEGLTMLEIAERFGVSAAAIQNQVQKKKLRKSDDAKSDTQERMSDSVDRAYIKELEKFLEKEREEKESVLKTLKEWQEDIFLGLRNIEGLARLTGYAARRMQKQEEADAIIVAMANILDTVEFLSEERIKNAPDARRHQGPQD